MSDNKKIIERHSVPDNLIESMMEVYKTSLKEGVGHATALRRTYDFLVNNGCQSSHRTVRRTVNKLLGGGYTLKAVSNSFKIDTSREAETETLQGRIEDIVRELEKKFYKAIEDKLSSKEIISYADAISRQRELQIRLLSLSPKKQNQSVSIDTEQAGRIIVASSIEENT